ncbi:MAG: hypothetical protein O7F09_06440, partial [Chloroflexi bacterium]|nr:hypothetical protein [Chloroflexota bacterium]
MRIRTALLALGLVIVAGLVVGQTQRAGAQAPPIAPRIFSGSVTVGGVPAPDGLQIVGRILSYETLPVPTSGGRYFQLIVGPPNNLVGQTLTFHILGVELTAADFVPGFQGGGSATVNLTFPQLPPPTPTPVPIPTATSTPVATPTPLPTATPLPTPTPLPQSEEQTVTVETTIQGSDQDFDDWKDAVSASFGTDVEVSSGPIELTTTDQGLVVEMPATGLTAGQQVTGDLSATVGNFSFETTDGQGTATIDLGSGLSVEGGVNLAVTEDGIDVILQEPQLIFMPEAPDAGSLAGGSEDVQDIGVDFQVDLTNLPDGASLEVQYAKDPDAFVDRPGITLQLAAQGVGGVIENPDEDVAFVVNVVKIGITNNDLGTNITTMTVSKAWFDLRQAEDKDIFITKLDEDGNTFTLLATCTPAGDVVECTVEFTGDAGGFSDFILISVAEVGMFAAAPPTPAPSTPTPVPTATSVATPVPAATQTPAPTA